MVREKSSWKKKSRYRIIAPENFDFRELGTTLSSEPKKLIGRRIDVSLKDLTDDRSKQHLKVIFEINKVEGDKALTQFKVFQANQGYIHSKVRKGMSKIDYIKSMKLDDSKVKIKVMAVTHRNIKTSQKREIISKITETVEGYKKVKLNDFLQATLFGKLGTGIYHNAKTVCPIRRVEIEEVRVV
ncbi:MAG: hypothetical protein U9Q22_04865 [Candidatus Altiarchaeota archaeon]|nr:hypothetical protein [Candidatus Altiarchaeota archaeon]